MYINQTIIIDNDTITKLLQERLPTQSLHLRLLVSPDQREQQASENQQSHLRHQHHRNEQQRYDAPNDLKRRQLLRTARLEGVRHSAHVRQLWLRAARHRQRPALVHVPPVVGALQAAALKLRLHERPGGPQMPGVVSAPFVLDSVQRRIARRGHEVVVKLVQDDEE